MKTKSIIIAIMLVASIGVASVPSFIHAQETTEGNAGLLAQLSSMLEGISNTLQSLTVSIGGMFTNPDENSFDAALIPIPIQISANLHPIISRASVPEKINAGKIFNLTTTSYDPTGDAYILKVDWGDTSSTVITYPKVKRTNTQYLAHSYPSARTYQINVRVIDADEKQGGDAQVWLPANVVQSTEKPALTISNVSGTGASPSSDQVRSVGAANETYLAFKLTAQNEPVKITAITIEAKATASDKIHTNTLQNIRLYRNTETAPFASAGQLSCSGGVCSYAFTAADNLLSSAIQPGIPATIYLRSNISPAGSADLNDNFVFNLKSIVAKGNSTGQNATISGTAAATGRTYVVPQGLVISGYSPTSNVTVGTGAGATLGVFKVSNNGSASITLSDVVISLSGSMTSTQQYRLYGSADGGVPNDTFVLLGTGSLSGGKIILSVSTTDANRNIQGNSWRYLTMKTVNAASENDNAALSINMIGDVKYKVSEANLGYSGNPSSDIDVSDVITGLPADGKPALATVTFRN